MATVPITIANFKDYSFVMLYIALLVTLLGAFTLFFFADVISKNSVEIIKQYLINVAMVDPTVADIIKAARGLCDATDANGNKIVPDSSKSPTNNVFGSTSASIAVYALAGISLVLFAIHLRYRLLDKVKIFSTNELISLSFLTIPLVLETVVYYFVYARYKYYSNVYLIKLMKNLRLRADIKYLTDLWRKDQAKIEASSQEVNGTCVNNCLPAADRRDLVNGLKSRLDEYDQMLDLGINSEYNKLQPKNIFSKLSKLPGKIGLILTIAAAAFLCRATYELNMNNTTVMISVVVAMALYAVFMYALQTYIASNKFKTTASTEYVNRLFCSTQTDVISKLLKRDLVNMDTAKEVANL